MLIRTFDPHLPYRVVMYLRMSDEMQNERSPEQQRAEIERRMKSAGYHWIVVHTYRDDAKTGRMVGNRRQYQKMLRDIKSGFLKVDLLLVDTLERLGRVDELPQIRKDLDEHYGVLVLTSDSGFVDPNSPAGKALGMVETMRATEHGRILAHNVLRGKRDTLLLKHWPGGPVPFGFELRSVMKIEKGREVFDYSILVPSPKTAWIIKLLFEKAVETGWGATRLARFLNEHSTIAAEYKDFQPETVAYWLDSELYSGTYVWEKNSTGIAGDKRIVRANDEASWLRVEEYCEAIVPAELSAKARELRSLRRRNKVKNRAADEKLIQAVAPGMNLVYLLSGLLVCSECGARMTSSSSSTYVTKAGEERRYVSYLCPAYVAGLCPNAIHVKEDWLRKMVVDTLRARLFPWNRMTEQTEE